MKKVKIISSFFLLLLILCGLSGLIFVLIHDSQNEDSPDWVYTTENTETESLGTDTTESKEEDYRFCREY